MKISERKSETVLEIDSAAQVDTCSCCKRKEEPNVKYLSLKRKDFEITETLCVPCIELLTRLLGQYLKRRR